MTVVDNNALIRATLNERADAIRNKDVQKVIDLFAPDSARYSLAPPLETTESLQQEMEEWFATWQGPIGYEVQNLSIATDDKVAFCHGLGHYTGTKTDGAKPDVWFRETLCLRKLNGRWLVTHSHESVPFYMDGSFKAAVDLQP